MLEAESVNGGHRDGIAALPKAELHLHLEGSVSPALLARLADRHGGELQGLSPAGVEAEVYRFGDFHSFLKAYSVVCRHLLSPEDYLEAFRLLESYFEDQNIRYAEVIYTPSIPWKFGRDGREVLVALLEESADWRKKSGIDVRWILDCVRQFGRAAAERTAQLAADFRDAGVVAVGLGGDEKSVPASEYGEVFSWARAHQLYVHVHAGEIGGPREIWDALEVLGANRIGHGVQAARDPALMEYLRDHAIGLDVCLTSNTRTRAWPLLTDHPLPLLLRRGVPVSLNTDDPGLFQTTLNAEFRKAVETYSLSQEELHRVILQGVRSAFLPHAEKMAVMQAFQDEIRNLGPVP